MYFKSYRCRKSPAKPKKCHFEAPKVTTSEMPETRSSLEEIYNCPKSCTEKLKITSKHTKGVMYTNINTYWVILMPFKHPGGLKRAYFAPKIQNVNYVVYLFISSTNQHLNQAAI